jgi:hypothetical protein
VAGDWHGLKSVVTSAVANEHAAAAAAAAAAPDVSPPESSEPDVVSIDAVSLSSEGISDNDDNDDDDDDDDGNSNGKEDGLFDLILTAETCYTEKVCGEVAALLSTLLKRHRGVALVASKRFYFGTGGGADCFKRDAEKLGLAVKVVAVEDDGRSNIREVMEVRRPRGPPS